ncbi:hypothetical protein [Phytomonospora endophytica]|uniref:Uncharacterized protein n=1 Tax=Phytomonospora endophytica TaxID=714109 RepID=A0A841FBL5_9ACTN|nr:hypothetical protein [Phytomonospora endophytica]MBB6034671.1 hypothetical protein [Phytomonospora endophytica]GIG69128.1 hypothetical protein Pen01_54230 [Phytomonospora endophytica]
MTSPATSEDAQRIPSVIINNDVDADLWGTERTALVDMQDWPVEVLAKDTPPSARRGVDLVMKFTGETLATAVDGLKTAGSCAGQPRPSSAQS